MILENFSLSGKTALVTGARTGIGQGIAVGLAQAGADIVGLGHSAMPETKEAIEALGRKFTLYEMDLVGSDRAGLNEMVDRIWNEVGGVDVLVNNAGIIRRADLLDFDEKDWHDVININQNALFFLSQAAAGHMVKEGRKGKIINIASMLTFQGGIRVPSYTASKSAVAGITRAMANELSPQGIQVNAIAPGYISTNNTAALRADEIRNAEILGRIPAGRWGTPEDLAGMAVFLASAASDYVTGSIFPVDGGWLSR
ncbi:MULTISPECIES: 2-dehydro-3-deoxy-D-gluconate 5-dehydrogenase KduD [Dethiosulfovibrio]|jgi:2-deoxy-D-gluconate 3-dehydrogenase|uniref:2-dehydro-3-deoxy-D-gluconate 5-dehydrogenase KduD n=2 Tax=Dethiosulfovibrio TaxID=47054 RepID=A0ABS9ELT3_9BACT|nr:MULTISPECIES: 2-dehydro-3-deoxy-D-gluconate 5-dehydrogenase KduD [Dethiosulfovibrio]MCF4113097.1 2-dehydro-3-deoxy-D-gluconate 5-dehydrogenase KduD [Dethiosulfovibrio russensis]MCF4142161.1 2-dehydro-3-deoxy-D-gluconate 5-dehydrogenase KduD [Dethiosulfovibrio marinus]MCF4145826.1 2-dehydro-3-deoxy-D-gluconate 5-dehydrogenase KduD [Dethiosulfovibrio acidaminovorans]